MNEARRILDLLAQGKITVDEADQLLKAVGTVSAEAPPRVDVAGPQPAAKFLRIAVLKAANEKRPEKNVSVRVPIALVKGGMQLGAMVPLYGDVIVAKLKERGVVVDLGKLDPAKLDELLRDMGELTVDVDEGRAQIRVTCE